MQWPVPVVAKLLTHYIETLDIDTLVTFDRAGVSSHKNHSAVFYAVAYMFVEKLMPKSKFSFSLSKLLPAKISLSTDYIAVFINISYPTVSCGQYYWHSILMSKAAVSGGFTKS